MPELPEAVTVSSFRCGACGTDHGSKPLRCQQCGDDQINEVALPGTGTLFTWTVVRRPPDAFADRGPMTVALVDIDSGPRLTVSLEEAEADPPLGSRVRVTAIRGGVPHCIVE